MNSTEIISKMKEAAFPDEIIESVMEKGELVEMKNQELILKEGEICDAMFFVLKGSFLSQYVDKITTNVKTVNFFSESYSKIMTSPKSYHRELPSETQLKAIKNSKVIVMPQKHIEYDIAHKTNPIFKDFYIKCLINQLIIENEF